MGNLTIDEGLVKETPDTNSLAGYKVAVFEKIGEGYKFCKALNPGETFKKQRKHFFGPEPSYFAYAVNTDPQLRLQFSDRFLHKNQAHSFDLTFLVDYCAANDEAAIQRLAERILSDPLKRLQDEIKHVIGHAVATLEWETIKTNRVEGNFEEVAQTVLTGTAKAQPVSNFDNLRKFAAELGIKLNGIGLSCNLLEPDIKRELAKTEAELKAELAIIQQHFTLRQKLLEKQLALAKQQDEEELRKIQRENELIEQRHTSDLRNLQLQTELKETLLASTNVALHHLASEVSSAESFMRAGDAVSRTFGQVTQTAGGSPALSGATVPPLLALSAAATDNLSKLLNEVFEKVAQLTCEPHEKRQLRAAILHMVAELSLSDKEDANVVTHYGAQIKELTVKLTNKLSREQFDFLCNIQDYERLREFLKQE